MKNLSALENQGESAHGGIAQLGERLNGIQEVSGSIPLISTKTTNHKAKIRLCGLCYRKVKRGIGYLDGKALGGLRERSSPKAFFVM